MNRFLIAEELYTKYCAAVGNVSVKGDPLPKWSEFASDPTHKPRQGWLAVADHVRTMLDETQAAHES